jgi:hypothetical protein
VARAQPRPGKIDCIRQARSERRSNTAPRWELLAASAGALFGICWRWKSGGQAAGRNAKCGGTPLGKRKEGGKEVRGVKAAPEPAGRFAEAGFAGTRARRGACPSMALTSGAGVGRAPGRAGLGGEQGPPSLPLEGAVCSHMTWRGEGRLGGEARRRPGTCCHGLALAVSGRALLVIRRAVGKPCVIKVGVAASAAPAPVLRYLLQGAAGLGRGGGGFKTKGSAARGVAWRDSARSPKEAKKCIGGGRSSFRGSDQIAT